ncbi:MAG: rhodanese-like domain-containing protein [gamma proteobacterium symbiont of Bathyaustriella thionipta]|nr:rhodanese-like domain-containing protein [gamma proteobacterium symbiont of Bathyaustriella thionipta]MCU7967046.1 rhodanese-like domain-containing protein [gamma proteobacterium symbiont of Bathyaustriella thionipta]
MYHLIKSRLVFLLFVFLVSFMSTVSAEVGQLSNAQLKKLMDENVPLIDIRRADEWQSTGVIKGSHLLTFFDARGNYDMEKWLADLDKIAKKNQKFILICRSGNRTGQVSNFLNKKLGYQQVYHLQRGIKNWIKAGDKVVSAK